MKKAFIISALVALMGFNLRADGTFTATYSNTDGLDQIGSQNNLTFYCNFDPAGNTSWSWAVFGWQGNWFYCDSIGVNFGILTTLVDDGSVLSFSTDQIGGTTPDCITVGNSITNVIFAEGALTVDINLDLDDSGGNLRADSVTVLTPNRSISHLAIPPPVRMQMTGKLLANGDMQLACDGIAGTNYTLERTLDLTAPNWVPQATNAATADGTVTFTNTPVVTANNFWRIRSAQ